MIDTDQELAYYEQLYSSLPNVETRLLNDDYKASFVGPKWLTSFAPTGLSLIGFKGWWGKRLRSGGPYINLADLQGKLSEFKPMQLEQGKSVIDNQPSVILSYPEGSGWPWTKVRDELRLLDEEHLLGMTIADLPVLRNVPMPFLLTKATALNTNGKD